MKELKELTGSALQHLGKLPDDQLNKMGYKRPVEKVDDDTKEYWDKLKSQDKIKWSDEQRKKHIKTMLSKKANSVGRSKFSPTEEQVKLLKLLYDYFSGQSERLNTRKGILLIGKTGVGKTSILSTFLSTPFKPFLHDDWYNEKPIQTSCIKVVDYYDMCNQAKSYIDWKAKYTGDVYFQDLGSEPKQKYATTDSEPVMSKLIEYRDNRANGRNFFCTNLSLDELSEKYGDRVASRLNGMCNVINLDAVGITKDFR
jgi:DNA replication protein DnaC